MSELVEQPCSKCGEPTYNAPPAVCRECHIEAYHERVEAMRCPSCDRIRYTNEPSDGQLVTGMRAWLWGEPCACAPHPLAQLSPPRGPLYGIAKIC